MKYTNSIAMAAIMLAAAFAGIALVADDADAADNDGLGDYKITYTFNGSSIVKKTDTGNVFKFTTQGAYTEPDGYKLDGWKDVASNTVYQLNTAYTIVADTVVEPYLVIKDDYAIINIDIDGKTVEVPVQGGVSAEATLIKGYADALEQAGLVDNSETKKDTENIQITKQGYVFEGFQAIGFPTYTTGELFNGVSFEAIHDAIWTAVKGADEGASLLKGEYTIKAVFTPVYNLAFVVDGTQVTSIKSNEFVLPSDPVKENFYFAGWAVDGKIISEVKDGKIVITDAYLATLTADTKFTAVFEPVKLTVTFDVDGKKSEATVLYGNTVMKPEAPVKEGFEFVAWMNGEVEFDFAKAVTENMTLTAKFKEVEPVTVFNIAFIGADGTVIANATSDSIGKTTVDAPAIDGKKFVGWSNGVEIVKDYKTYEYTKDTTLTAVYTEADPAPAPGFFETTTGKCVGILIGFLIVVFVYLMITDAYGMRTATMSFLRRKKD